jgi:hypothetical protein
MSWQIMEVLRHFLGKKIACNWTSFFFFFYLAWFNWQNLICVINSTHTFKLTFSQSLWSYYGHIEDVHKDFLQSLPSAFLIHLHQLQRSPSKINNLKQPCPFLFCNWFNFVCQKVIFHFHQQGNLRIFKYCNIGHRNIHSECEKLWNLMCLH